MTAASAQPLDGHSVLIVEDEFLVAMMLADTLEDAGAAVVGPAATREEGLALVASATMTAAVLDWNLAGACSDVLARALREKGGPFMIATGYGRVPEEFSGVPVIGKPFDPVRLVEELTRIVPGPGTTV